MDTESIRTTLRQSLAKAYCDDKNEKKVLDPDLVESMVDHLIKDLTLPEHLDWEFPTKRIPASDRVLLATRTEAPVTPEMLQRFQNPEAIRLLHAVMGLSTEICGEMMDGLKKHFFYGRPVDIINMKEELGDCDWYMNLACSVLHTTMQIIEIANIKKLAQRYGDKFSQDAALIRNLDAELQVLQENLDHHYSDPDFKTPKSQPKFGD